MNTAPLIYWETALDRGPARVKFIRAIICPPLGCTPRHVAAGEEVTISAETLDQLTGGDIEILGPVPPELAFEI